MIHDNDSEEDAAVQAGFGGWHLAGVTEEYECKRVAVSEGSTVGDREPPKAYAGPGGPVLEALLVGCLAYYQCPRERDFWMGVMGSIDDSVGDYDPILESVGEIILRVGEFLGGASGDLGRRSPMAHPPKHP